MIRVSGVSLSFGARPVLDGLSLDVEDGKTTVIIGRSGIGKSVLLRCITALLLPQEGSITVDGEEVLKARGRDLLRIRGKIGMLFQEGALFDSMNVYDNVAFPLVYHKKDSRAEIDKKVLRYLGMVRMEDAVNAMPRELSGGMKRKVAIARAMILEPKYLLYDEPTAGLDPASSAVVEVMINQLREETGITSLVVTHDIDLTRYVADGIALLEEGRIMAAESRDEAFRKESPIYGHFLEKRERIREEHGHKDQ
jgi:phospholipid/cholesterol/gamma-HCH transport system ATP-binding protein